MLLLAAILSENMSFLGNQVQLYLRQQISRVGKAYTVTTHRWVNWNNTIVPPFFNIWCLGQASWFRNIYLKMQGVPYLGQYNHPIESLLFVTWYHKFVIQLPHHQSALCSFFRDFNCCWAVGLIDQDPQDGFILARSPAVGTLFFWWAPIILPARHGIMPLSGHLHTVYRGTAPSMSCCASSTVALWFPSCIEIALRHLSWLTAIHVQLVIVRQRHVVDSSWSPSGIRLSWTPFCCLWNIFHCGSPLFMSASCRLSTALLLPPNMVMSCCHSSHLLWSFTLLVIVGSLL